MSTLLQGLNDEQLKAVTHATDGPLLIIAGAGTGKTTVITRRIAYLLEQNLAKPEEILALTFTDKAAGEMEERVDQLVPLGLTDFWVSTFHSFCQRILEMHGLDIGLSNSFRLLDDIKQWILIHNNFDKFELDYYRPLGSPNRFISSMLDHFSKCKDELITPEEYLDFAQKLELAAGSGEGLVEEDLAAEVKRIKEIAGAYHTYQKLLLDNEYLDFGDLINYTIELFTKRPNVLKIYQKQFKYILVDEFQDTNFAQYQLIKLLTGVTGKNKTAVNQLMVVGDDDQSIYKFRGASVSNILKLKEEFADVDQVTLIQNYRSCQEILDLAYNFIQQNNPDRLEAKLGINKQLKANLDEPCEIQVLQATDLSSELNCVIDKVTQLKLGNPQSTWNDFAILIRANSAADEIIPRLESAQIPYTFVANRGLFKKPIITDIINYLKLLDQYHESAALYRVLNLPLFNIDPEQIAILSNYSHKKTLSLYETLKQAAMVPGVSEQTQTAVSALLKLIAKHSDLKQQKTAVELFVQIITDLGIVQHLKEDTQAAAENRELVDQFYKRIEEFEQTAEDKSLNAFMNALDLEIRAGDLGAIKFDPNLGPESLKVMTIHSAKGLEFKYAFIINMVDQRFPTRAKSDAIKIPDELVKDILPEGNSHLQEERRLFYVAITRAKTHLYLSWSKDYGGAKPKKPSVFLEETNLVPSEKVNQATGKVVFTKKPNPSKPTKEVYKYIPNHFSFSDIATFRTCPLEYKFKNYLRLPLPGAPQLSFGISIHGALQKFAKEYQAAQNSAQGDLFAADAKRDFVIPKFKLMEKFYEECFVDEWYHDKKEKEQYRQAGKTMLKDVYDDFAKRKPLVKFIEQKFTLPLQKYTIVGRIDRADLTPDNKLTIIDYKTNGLKKYKDKLEVDQLKVYQWAAQDSLGYQVAQMYYWHLKDNQISEQKLSSPEEIEELKVSITQTIEEIIESIKFDLFEQKHLESKQHFCRF